MTLRNRLLSHSENTQPLMMTYKALGILSSTLPSSPQSQVFVLLMFPKKFQKIKYFKFCILIFSIQNSLLPVRHKMGPSYFSSLTFQLSGYYFKILPARRTDLASTQVIFSFISSPILLPCGCKHTHLTGFQLEF